MIDVCDICDAGVEGGVSGAHDVDKVHEGGEFIGVAVIFEQEVVAVVFLIGAGVGGHGLFGVASAGGGFVAVLVCVDLVVDVFVFVEESVTAVFIFAVEGGVGVVGELELGGIGACGFRGDNLDPVVVFCGSASGAVHGEEGEGLGEAAEVVEG